jgi:membrane protease YdiL (CAAX protease family)
MLGRALLSVSVVYRMGPGEAGLSLASGSYPYRTCRQPDRPPHALLLATTSPLNPGGLALAPLLSTGVLAPFTEEVLFRGYLFLQLYRRAGWVLFTKPVLIALCTLAVIGLGVFAYLIAGRYGTPFVVARRSHAWLLTRWEENLWVPISAHWVHEPVV